MARPRRHRRGRAHGVAVKGLFYLLILGVAVLVTDFIFAGIRLSRRRRPAR